jgi:alanyl-tRNA synthetase
MTREELDEVERMVNRAIRDDLRRRTELLSYEDAVAGGAMALFGEKYGDTVRVVSFEGFSRELCGGTHVDSTGQIGLALIQSETSVAAGVRRILMVVGEAAEEEARRRGRLLESAAAALGTAVPDLVARATQLREELRRRDRDMEKLREQVRQGQSSAAETLEVAGIPFGFQELAPGEPVEEVRRWADSVFDRLGGPGVAVVVSAPVLVVKVAQEVNALGLLAGRLCAEGAAAGGGRGGGRPTLAEGGGIQPGSEPRVRERIQALIHAAAGVPT